MLKANFNLKVIFFNLLTMQQSRSLKLNKLTALKKEKNQSTVSPSETTSPYFSPKKTRNQIKIQYDHETVKDITAGKSKNKISLKRHAIKNDSNSEIIVTKVENFECNIKETKQQKWEPNQWRETLDNLRKMRQKFTAPVDSMGCSKCSTEEDEKTKRFHILVSLMLSSQTKDQVTYDAMQRLQTHGLTPENIVKTSIENLETLIHPVSFYRNKSKFIKNASKILIDKYQSDIPNNLNDLIKLPGVGPKMAHICMSEAWNIVTGIGVDTHVHRISNRLKWTEKTTKTPEKTRIALEKWVPHELWDEINLIMVGFGQTICTPIAPKCDICSNNEICPSKMIKKNKNKNSN